MSVITIIVLFCRCLVWFYCDRESPGVLVDNCNVLIYWTAMRAATNASHCWCVCVYNVVLL